MKGIDALGILHKNYPLRRLNGALPPGSAVGVLIDTTFGGKLDPIRKLLDGGNVSTLVVDLLNNTAVRNKKLYDTEMLKGYTLAKVEAEAKRPGSNLYKLIDKQLDRLRACTNGTGVSVWCSALLEHNLSREAAVMLCGHISRTSPHRPVDSPMLPNYARLHDVVDETHGNDSRGESRSNDGADASDANLFEDGYFSGNYDVALLWKLSCNGNYSGLKQFVPPRDRKHFTTPDEFKWLRYILLNPAEQRPIIAGARTLKQRELWKIEAEDYKDGDPRGGRPLFICRSTAKRITILNQRGKNIGWLKYYGPYSGDPGYNRFYLGTGSGENCVELLEKAEGEWVVLTDGKTKWLVNSVRRCGYYRS